MTDELALAPRDLSEARVLAGVLSKTSILPPAVRGKEADILLTIMAGRELGLGPILSLRSIHVIEGRTSLSADLIAALCLRSSICEGLDLVESTATRASYVALRRGRKPVSLSFTAEEAQTAGLLGKDNWRKYPAAMLRARCVSAICRAVFPDLVGGLYDPDEIDERDITPRPALTRPPVGVTPQTEAETVALLEASIAAVAKPRLLQVPTEAGAGPNGAPQPAAPAERAKLEAEIAEAGDEAALNTLVERITRLQPIDKAAIRGQWGARRDELRSARSGEAGASEASP